MAVHVAFQSLTKCMSAINVINSVTSLSLLSYLVDFRQ